MQFFSRAEDLVVSADDETVEELGEFPIGTSSLRNRSMRRLLRRSRPSLSAARPGPLGQPGCLAAARRDGADLSWPDESERRPTVVTVVDNASKAHGTDRG